MKNLLLLFPILLLINCAIPTKNKNGQQQEIIWVNSLRFPCTGVVPMSCLQIQKGEVWQPDGWEYFYDNIEGFEFQAGYLYQLVVKKEILQPGDLPADVSSIKYTLIEMIEKKPDAKLRLHDIWAVERIEGEPFKVQKESPRAKRPMLEIYIADKKILGNDGCNQIFGKLKKLTDTDIQFGIIGGTKMACPDMEMPEKFTDGLAKTTSYKINNLKLIFFDKVGKEVLAFRKVD